MTRVVIDTNVFISSFFGGNPRKIIDLWKSGDILWCVSQPVIEESIDVLKRMGLDGERELKDLLDLFSKGFNVLFAAGTPDLKIIEKDPDDDKFIECAVALNARFIVSGDKALTEIKKYMEIQVLTPKQFLDEYKRMIG